MHDGTRRIGILLFPDVEELDAIGPWEVLAWWTRVRPEDGWAVTTLSRDGGPCGVRKDGRWSPITPTPTPRRSRP